MWPNTNDNISSAVIVAGHCESSLGSHSTVPGGSRPLDQANQQTTGPPLNRIHHHQPES